MRNVFGYTERHMICGSDCWKGMVTSASLATSGIGEIIAFWIRESVR
jgi:hypothetical protein